MSYHWTDDIDVTSLSNERLIKATKRDLVYYIIREYRSIMAGQLLAIREQKRELARLAGRTEELAAELEQVRYHVLDGDASPVVDRWKQGREAGKVARAAWVPPRRRRT